MRRNYKSHLPIERTGCYVQYGQEAIKEIDSRQQKTNRDSISLGNNGLCLDSGDRNDTHKLGERGSASFNPADIPFPHFCKKWCGHYDCSYVGCERRKK